MKLRRIQIANARSFLTPQELLLDGDISIVIGPNGGGKTNLLDIAITVLRRHLLTSWVSRRSPNAQDPDRIEYTANQTASSLLLERHSRGTSQPQVIELDLELTPPDLMNMIRMTDTQQEFSSVPKQHVGLALASFKAWDLVTLYPGQVFTFRIVNDRLEEPSHPSAQMFRQYLAAYEAESQFRSNLGREAISMPMISMPVNRAASGFQASLALAGYDEFGSKQSVDAATSRSTGAIVTMALGRLARRFRGLLEKDDGRAREKFRDDPQIQSLTGVLESLGYSWALECTNPDNNQYDVRLTKEGSSFLVSAASSGEKELLTYLFAIYGLNVRDALVIVDEPELHLHPRWQKTLLDLFERLSVETGNQFLLATHSPSFVSPASIHYVSRVYTHDQESHIVRIENRNLPSAKHLFSIVNSQNNERMFFADKVVLVEGITDRLVFEAVFKRLGVTDQSSRTCEIVSVGGKNFFPAYEQLLEACRVPHAVIADRDYVHEIADMPVRQLFSVSSQVIDREVVRDQASVDGRSLLHRLDEAIASGDVSELRAVWEYIKGRRTRLRADLTEQEQHLLDQFIIGKRDDAIFVLRNGDLETYLPAGYRSKDLNKLVDFVNRDFWNELSLAARDEFETIATFVRQL